MPRWRLNLHTTIVIIVLNIFIFGKWFLNMENDLKIYIAREYLLTDDYGGMRIDEEAAFFSFKEAEKYLETLWDKEADGDDLLLFRTEIVEFITSKVESYLRKWIYNLKGELVDISPPPNEIQLEDDYKHIGKFRVGDIVYIVPKIKKKLSPSIKGAYGVIVEVPSPEAGQFKSGKNKERKEYTIYYITETGLFDHLHVVESALKTIKAELPVEVKFLEVYSRHLRKEKELPHYLIEQILNDKISVKNIRAFDFKNFTILDAFRDH